MSEEPQITFFQGTDVGMVRDHNEDWVAVQDPADPEMKLKGRLFIVADGMGGYQAGEVASRMAAEIVVRDYYADPSDDPITRLRNAVQAANGEVHRQAQNNPSRAGMGTTMVVAAVIGRKAYIASVGDSRAYVIRRGELSQITQDHSFVGEQVRAGILTKEQARVHPQRNVITRALGSQPGVLVDTFEGELSDGDVLVMCTDGLTGHVSEDHIRDVAVSLTPDQAVAQLIQMAKDDGGTDNISTIVLRVGPLPLGGEMATTPALGLYTAAPAAGTKPAIGRPARRQGPSLIWVGAGVLSTLIIVGILGLVVLSVSGVLSVGGRKNVTPTVPASPQAPTTTPVETIEPPTVTPLPTLTLAPTFTATHTPTPTRKPLNLFPTASPTIRPSSTVLPSPLKAPTTQP